MNALHPSSVAAPRAVVDSRRFRLVGLLCVAFCGLPTAWLLAAGRLTLAANWFWVALALMLVGLMVAGKHQLLLSMLLGVGPFIGLLRGYGIAFYNATLATLLMVLVFYFVRSPQALRDLCRQYRGVLWMGAAVGGYYGLSLLATGDYTRNLRMFELWLAVICLLVAGRSRAVLGTGLLGFVIASAAIGLAMMPHNASIGRLGMIVIEGASIGNPAQLGMALVMGFLVLIVDHGQWLNWPGSRIWRWVLFALTATMLALTTSRVAWLVACVGLLLVVVAGQRQRLGILLAAATAVLLLFGALQTPFGPALQRGLDRTFGSERTLRNRTSGRSDQWTVAYQASIASWERVAWGYGPGRGSEVYARVSQEVPDVKYGVGERVSLHSLFMQVMVEAGLLGLIPMVVALLYLGYRVIQWRWRTGLMLPVVLLFGYFLSICTVAGTGVVDGMMLGFAFFTTARGRLPRGTL